MNIESCASPPERVLLASNAILVYEKRSEISLPTVTQILLPVSADTLHQCMIR